MTVPASPSTLRVARPGVATPAAPAGFGALVRSELTKIRTWRAGRLLLAVAPLVAAVASALFVVSVPLTMSKAVVDLTGSERLEITLMGADVANLITLVLAILFVSDERASKVLQLSLQITPDRRRYLLGKLAAVLAVVVVVSALSVLFGFGGGAAALALSGAVVPALTEPATLRALGGIMLMGPIHALLGLTLAFMLRGGIVAFLAVFFVMCLPTLLGLLPDALERAGLALLLTPALHTLAGIAEPTDLEYSSVPWAAAVLVVWACGLVSLAGAVFRRQDL